MKNKQVYIENFTMPKSCHECPFGKWDYCWCTCLVNNVTREDIGNGITRPRKNSKGGACPLKFKEGR